MPELLLYFADFFPELTLCRLDYIHNDAGVFRKIEEGKILFVIDDYMIAIGKQLTFKT
ncbi:MAG: hypothetical protein HZA14_06890 [Nitrospirae bacterium]|nr:hypothetical protein [Nitrospirota bacterium]